MVDINQNEDSRKVKTLVISSIEPICLSKLDIETTFVNVTDKKDLITETILTVIQ